MSIYQTVVETPEFIRQAERCMDAPSRQHFINYIAQSPLAGDVMPGTGGIRKVRWTGNSHQGKRGGMRVIYVYYAQTMPLFLLTVYGKGQEENLTMKEQNALKVLVKQLIQHYQGGRHE